ncbi:rhodanese-like domain-containing protein [Marinibaculum pumilum]|uniref:Rhodanese-like domain-containing protein n=1 Tax=Marinibaculum pumilum TaxID=1766165 RepID=A0ABV7KTY0_9PROT
MFLETVKSEGLAHLSYILGADGEAVVVDPRRDCEVYVEIARSRGARIVHILETHRNEDLVSGAPVLAKMTGATVHHGPNPEAPIAWAQTIRDGEAVEAGPLRLHAIETPGHTYDHMAYAIEDRDSPHGHVGVFTGDALFVGDVGRTDFYPDEAEKVAALLFDSLQKLLALGDQAIIYPAHGAGSVCGSGMADREFSTIGHERLNNPRLQLDRQTFVRAKTSEHHQYPPYFRAMERINIAGAADSGPAGTPAPCTAAAVAAHDGPVVDVRPVNAFQGAHWPGSLCLPVGMLSAFAGWYLEAEAEIVLVADDGGQAAEATRRLGRIGFDRVAGYFDGLVTATAGGQAFGHLPVVGAAEVARRRRRNAGDWTLLDVRDIDEWTEGHIPGAVHAYVGRLPDQADRLDPERRITTMCASGARATVAAGWLKANGFEDVDVFLGSMGAWRSRQGEVESGPGGG